MTETHETEQALGEQRSPHSLLQIIDRLGEAGEDENVTVADLLSAFDNRSYGPLLLIPSLLALGPTGAIPGASMAMALLIILIAGQMLLSHGKPWLPERIRAVSFPRSALEKGLRMARPAVGAVERWIGPRLVPLTVKPWSYGIPPVAILFALTMFPLAFVPFAAAIPAAALTLLSLGLMLKDGYLVLAGYAIGAASLYAVLAVV